MRVNFDLSEEIFVNKFGDMRIGEYFGMMCMVRYIFV